MNDEKDRELGEYLNNIGVRYGEPFILLKRDNNDACISHSYPKEAKFHPPYLVDIFCYYGSRFPNKYYQYNNTLQLYDINYTKLDGIIPITRTPFWINTPADRCRVDQFLNNIRDRILNNDFIIYLISERIPRSFGDIIEGWLGLKKDRNGERIRV